MLIGIVNINKKSFSYSKLFRLLICFCCFGGEKTLQSTVHSILPLQSVSFFLDIVFS